MARLILALVLFASTARAATVTGRVLQDGFRVAEYGVSLAGRPDLAILVQDGQGQFTLRGIPPGRHRLVLVGWSFERRTIDIDVMAAESEVALGNISVEAGRALGGRVVDASGTAVAGATVIVYETRPVDLDASPIELMVGGAQLTTSRHDGTFTVHGLPADPQGLRALAFGDDMVSSEHVLGSHVQSAELTIGRLGTIAGKVTNRSRMKSPVVIATPAGFAGKPKLAGVDPSGAFRFDLPAGVYDLSFPDETAAPLQVVVVGERTRAVTMTAPTAHVDLVVETADCVYVRLLGARPQSRTPRTEIGFAICEEDRARFTRLPPGPYRVCVDTDDEAACRPLQLRAAPETRTFQVRQ